MLSILHELLQCAQLKGLKEGPLEGFGGIHTYIYIYINKGTYKYKYIYIYIYININTHK